MKQNLASTLFAAAILLSAPAFSQKEKEKENDKKKEEVQHIMITRTGDPSAKTVIEITGDKVLINGKEATDNKEVNVHVSKVKDGSSYAFGRGKLGATAWNVDVTGDHMIFNGERISLFSEDSNRAMLGVVTDAHDKGAKIVEISAGQAAEKAGLKEGDIIIRIDDKKVEDAEDVSTAVRAHKPGEKVNIAYIRDGKEQKVTAELGKWKGLAFNKFNAPVIMDELKTRPTRPGETRVYGYASGNMKLGLSVQDTDEGKGVKVIEVDEETNAAKAGLQENDVITHINEKEVNTTDEVTRIVKENREKASIQLKVLRAGKVQNIEVRMPRKIKTADL